MNEVLRERLLWVNGDPALAALGGLATKDYVEAPDDLQPFGGGSAGGTA